MATSSINQTASDLLAALYPVRVIDETAETAEEIAAKLGKSMTRMRQVIFDQVRSGRLEQVWKHGRTRLVPAYRAVKK